MSLSITAASCCTCVVSPRLRPRFRESRGTWAAAAMGGDRGSGSDEETQGASTPAQSAASSFTTRLEHMDTLVLRKEPGPLMRYEDLDLAEKELGSYCIALGPEANTEKCWQAYSFLERKREVATASCDWEHPETCDELEHLNKMAHQLLSTGSVDDLVATLSTLARVEELKAAKAAKQEAAAAKPPPEHAPQPDPILVLFQRMDLDGDGKLSVSEFRQGMAMLGDELDDWTLSLIADALDIHGFMSEQQFRDILEAEAINSKSEMANIWRHQHSLNEAWKSLS